MMMSRNKKSTGDRASVVSVPTPMNANDQHRTTISLPNDRHATKFPSPMTDMQQNFPRKRTALAPTNVVSALFVASRLC
jgi:hypothetical protein